VGATGYCHGGRGCDKSCTRGTGSSRWSFIPTAWRVPRHVLLMARIGNYLAYSAYASPSTTRWVRNCNGGPACVPVRSWPVRNLDSGFAEVDLATGAREASVVLEVEQYRNNIVGDVKNISSSPCRIKKATVGGPLLATPMHTVQNVPCTIACINRITPLQTPPPLVTSSTTAATTPRSGAPSRPPRTLCRRRGRRAKRRQQARAIDAQEAGRGGGGGWVGGGLPQLVGRQVEKVRRCRVVNWSLCRQHSPTAPRLAR
jgi:hypothetical protein